MKNNYNTTKRNQFELTMITAGSILAMIIIYLLLGI